MSKQPTQPTGTVKKTKKPLPLSPLLAQAKSRKPLLLKSHDPNDPNSPPSFMITSPTPSLRWRSKPSIKNCHNDNLENAGPSGTTVMLNASAIDSISSHKYDRLKATLHSTVLPSVVPKGSQAERKSQKLMMGSKSVFEKPQKQILTGQSTHKGSTQSIPAHAKHRYWVPTPSEMAKIGDKIPKAFVKTSLTGRKTVQVPTDTRTWLHGNLTPIESSSSVTENQAKLVRGGRLLKAKLKKKDTNSPPPAAVAASTKLSKVSKVTEPPAVAGKKPAKAAKDETSSKIAAPSKITKPNATSSKTSGELPSSFQHHKNRPFRPYKLDTVYVNTASQLRLNRVESSSTHSLPPPYTPSNDAQASPDKNVLTTVSLGFSTFVECFYCHVRYPIDNLREHQDECSREQFRRRRLETWSSLDYVSQHFENSFHKLNFNTSSCSLLTPENKPLFIEEGGRLSALPAKVSSNDAFYQTCWYCGWDYSPEIAERHMADCAAVRGTIRPTAEGKRLRRLVERKMKTYGKLNRNKKNLWR